MRDGKYVVGITVIGGGVGQSIVSSCRLAKIPLYTIGFGSNSYAMGMYDCDDFVMTPSIYDINYIQTLLDICINRNVDILVPGLDDEIDFLSKERNLFIQSGIKVLLPDQALVDVCRDKKKMYEYFSQYCDYFIKTYTIEELSDDEVLKGAKFPLIAKPLGGRGSKGITILQTPNQLSTISANYIIQEIAFPHSNDLNHETYTNSISKSINPQISEISIQLVADNNGRIIGRMKSYNKLSQGVPIEILPFDDPVVWDVINQIMPYIMALGFKGPLNIQGRMTDEGFKIFEMNCRFTGITGLRAIMGFNEVEECIKSWLGLPTYPLEINKSKFGIRKALDKTVEIQRNDSVQNDFNYINHSGPRRKEALLLIDSTGFMSKYLIPLIDPTAYAINVLNIESNPATNISEQENVKLFEYTDFENGSLSIGNIDKLLLLNYDNPNIKPGNVMLNLRKISEVINQALLHQVAAILNISSHSVYGNQYPSSHYLENDPVSPESASAQALYAIELMANNLSKVQNQIKVATLRLATVVNAHGNDSIANPVNQIINKMVKKERIDFSSCPQVLDVIDIIDAVQAIYKTLQTSPLDWKPIYNVGINQFCHLDRFIEILQNFMDAFHLQYNHELNIPQSTMSAVGMNCDLFRQELNWSPRYNLEDIVRAGFKKELSTG